MCSILASSPVSTLERPSSRTGIASEHIEAEPSKTLFPVDSTDLGALPGTLASRINRLDLNKDCEGCKQADEMLRAALDCLSLMESTTTASTAAPMSSMASTWRFNPATPAADSPSPEKQGHCRVGKRVLARFGKSKLWYPAVVEEVHENGQATIKWDDGDLHDRLKPITQLQVFQPVAKFAQGQQVLARVRDVPEILREALAHSAGPWCLARITSFNLDGTFTVSWSDRTKKNRTKRLDELWALRADISKTKFNDDPCNQKASATKRTHGPVFSRLYSDAERRHVTSFAIEQIVYPQTQCS